MPADAWERGDPDEPESEPAFGAAEPEEDPEGPQAADLAAGDEYGTTACPACGAAVFELAERCGTCGEWIVPGSGSSRRGRAAAVALALLLIALLLLWLL